MSTDDNAQRRTGTGAGSAPHPFFDSPVYPWHRREARELHRALYQAVSNPSRIELLYRQSGPALRPLLTQVPADIMWKEALEELTRSRYLKPFFELLVDESALAALRPYVMGAVEAVESASHSRADSVAVVRTAIAGDESAAANYPSLERAVQKFLADSGLTDQFKDYLPSLLEEGVEYYSCFISYSTRDQAFADRLYADLQTNGVRCWFAPHDIRGGQKIHDQVDQAIQLYDRLLLILSEASMASEWVKTEIAKARQKERRQGRQVLFPVRIVPFDRVREWEAFDADTGKDSAREIREYYIPDFTRWTDGDAYRAAFEKLMNDLREDENNVSGR